ncbi:probable pectinesterase/pectinesterase inhibitor 12 [Asparagus officinalis]|uniref:probable pectinesterase/pectinesterase inhibitor 12 n=1 Tax=Asparagus officinalis TaxID=4686 RepID=UPI00098E65BE|nr:probable pectinesterase/pectinesterase inhibitor 12 [Asparagus officinalis]
MATSFHSGFLILVLAIFFLVQTTTTSSTATSTSMHSGGLETLIVAQDGSGNFTKIGDAISFAPNNSNYRTIIKVKAGIYYEYLEIPENKPNLMLYGEGSNVTEIRGNRSVGDGCKTLYSATVAVLGQGFIARDISFINTAGASKNQAVALRVDADMAAFYRCAIDGYQDTLYARLGHQFYRECDISGTVDFIFGDATAVFQMCNIYVKLPASGQSNTITAQGRKDEDDIRGFSLQNCSILPSQELAASNVSVKTFLGRPWKTYAVTVYIKSYLDSIVDPSGWMKWSDGDDPAMYKVYYGEYANYGPGKGTQDTRINWPGFHWMEYEEARNFSVSRFIKGDEWLPSTSIPFDDGI